jgi:hypothetical protein
VIKSMGVHPGYGWKVMSPTPMRRTTAMPDDLAEYAHALVAARIPRNPPAS